MVKYQHGLYESLIKVIDQYPSIAIPIAKKKRRIIRSERIPHFNAISFEEDQKFLCFFKTFNALHLVKNQTHLNKPTATVVDTLNKIYMVRH